MTAIVAHRTGHDVIRSGPGCEEGAWEVVSQHPARPVIGPRPPPTAPPDRALGQPLTAPAPAELAAMADLSLRILARAMSAGAAVTGDDGLAGELFTAARPLVA